MDFMLGWFLYIIIAIATSLNWFAADYIVCSSVNIPSFLTIFTKYLLKTFAISDSSLIIPSFSTNLITALQSALQSARIFCYQLQTLYQDLRNDLFLACEMIFF